MTPEAISAEQRALRVPILPTTRGGYLREARWWELEAMRPNLDYEVERGEWVREGKRLVYRPGVTSRAKSLQYARNMRLLAELASIYGSGTCLELKARRAAAGGVA